jgi:HTH-type transcriptional regulator/antitoxin HipB
MDYPIHFAEQLSQHLRSFRKSRGLTQAQLALQWGVSQSRVANIENHPGTVSLDNLLAVLSALDVRVLLRDTARDPYPVAKGSNPKTLAERKEVQDKRISNKEDW